MQIEWLKKQGSGRVLLFFNGWGMDAGAVAHLACDGDMLAVCDYRDLEQGRPEGLEAYAEVDVVAWSMGVWAAANVLPAWGIVSHRLVALNGTEHPVDDRWGIPVRIYRLTELGMNEEGRRKFTGRMFDKAGERPPF